MSKVPQISVGPAKLPRNGFDCSESHIYSQPAGMLLPVYHKFLKPHDHIEIDMTSIVQAQTLRGRPFLGMKQNFAAYFVPCRLLWSYSDSFFSGLLPRNTITSSVLSKESPKSKLSAPSFPLYDVFLRFAGLPDDEHKVFDASGTLVKQYSAAESQVIYSQKLLGKTIPDNFSSFCDPLGYPLLHSYIRLCDMLGYGSMPVSDDKLSVRDVTKPMLSYQANLFNWLAYQKIYQDHFLDTNYEVPDAACYNVDAFFDGSTGKTRVQYSRNIPYYTKLFCPRYVKYEKDLLSNIHPSPLFLSDVTSTIKSFVGESGRIDGDDVFMDTQGAFVSVAQLRNAFALDRMAQISSRAPKTYRDQILAHYGVNVSANRTESMYLGGFQRYLEVSPVIATADGSIPGTNGVSSSSNFGQQGAYIDNMSNGHVNFDCNDFGVLMVVSWFSPDSLYDNDGIDAFATKFFKEDYFTPEAEDLGLQPITLSSLIPAWCRFSSYFNLVHRWQINDSEKDHKFGTYYLHQPVIETSKVYGWQPRYSEYKSSFDKVHGEFKRNRSMSIFTTHRPTPFNQAQYVPQDKYKKKKDEHGADYYEFEASIVKNQSSVLRDNPIPANFLYVDPSCTDDVVEVAYDGSEATDPFRITTRFDVKYISDMSVSGLPRL